MANKKIQMTAYNGSSWDNIYPQTLSTAGAAGRLVASDGSGGLQLGPVSVGSSSAPIYLNASGIPTACSFTSGYALIGNGSGITTRNITNNTTAKAITASTNLITANTLYNALPKFNGSDASTYSRNTDFYVPTSKGTSGNILTSSGTGSPLWGSSFNISFVESTINLNGMYMSIGPQGDDNEIHIGTYTAVAGYVDGLNNSEFYIKRGETWSQDVVTLAYTTDGILWGSNGFNYTTIVVYAMYAYANDPNEQVLRFTCANKSYDVKFKNNKFTIS